MNKNVILPSNLQEAIDLQAWQHVPEIIEQTLVKTEQKEKTNLLGRMAKILRLESQWQLAIDTFLLALRFHHDLQDAIVIHQNLSEIYAELKEYSKATAHGTIAIGMNNQLMMLHAPKKKLIAFSLYGSNPVYCENLMVNLQKLPNIYPDWQVAVYHDSTVPTDVLRRLREQGVEVIDAKDIHAEHLPGTFWRFFALERSDCAVVIMRDADSVIGERERQLVDEWLISDKPFHIIRDWYGQTDLILAGLWGVKNGLLMGIRDLITTYLKETPHLHPTHADQYFLASQVWPRIRDFALHHSSVIPYDQSTWPKSLPTINYLPDGSPFQLGAWLTSFFEFKTPSDFIFIMMEGDKTIFQYALKKDTKVELPRSYRENVESGKWHYKVVLMNVSVAVV